MTVFNSRAKRATSLIAIVGAASFALTACSNGGASSSAFTYLGVTEQATVGETLTSLSENECKAENTAAPLELSDVAQTALDQKIQLLAGQDALSNMDAAGGSPALLKDLIASGQAVNLTEAGVEDAVLPAAASTLKALYGSDSLYALPVEFNIEGIWYNKQILSANGIDVPTTWDELVAASAKLQAAGVQPLAASGEQGWPITRLVGNYIFRSLGPDAMQAVADGKAKLTDPQYVAAAQAVADLGAAGYFGQGVTSLDYASAENLFLNGQAAFFYMGSWALGDYNDPEKNKIGAENVGYAAFPAVTGGKGSIDQVPANAGIPQFVAKKGFDKNQQAWVSCIANNYGNNVLNNKGVISGFKITDAPADLPALTQEVQGIMADAPSSVLWFEALFNSEATTVSQKNGAGLANGSLSGADFMGLVQAALDKGN